MKLQVAIDRVDLATAITMANKLDKLVDVIEFGTSLVKDYGLIALGDVKKQLTHAQLLLDLKTIDEGVYEFEKGFAAHADILTVMGASSAATLSKVYDVTQKNDKTMLIDMMEMPIEQIAHIVGFEDAIYNLHYSHDSEHTDNVVDTIAAFHQQFPMIKHLTVAGGIDLATASELAKQGIVETVIVGSKIAGAIDPVLSAQKFNEVIK